MDMNKALHRVWRKWKLAFLVAFITYILVFIWAFNYEVHREEEGLELEEALELFSVDAGPRITAGPKAYTINITNNREYSIQQITVAFQNIQPNKLEDFQESYDDTVNGGAEISYSNPVYPTATAVDIILDGQEVITGLTDLNLYLEKEGGTASWSSASPGNDEVLHLTQHDLENAGYGDYKVYVRHESGVRDVSFQLTYSITYSTPVLVKSSELEIEPGGSYEFEFALNLDPAQVSELECVITAAVELSSGLQLELVMVYDSGWVLIRMSQPVPEESVDEVPWGPVDLTGTSGVILYSITIITGFIFYVRIKLQKDVKLKRMGWLHCFISLMALIFVLVHMSTAMLKVWNWPWGSAGMNFAVSALGLLIVFTIFSLFDVEFIKILGRRKWRWVHLALTFGLLALIVLHFGLMGDHLGWLI